MTPRRGDSPGTAKAAASGGGTLVGLSAQEGGNVKILLPPRFGSQLSGLDSYLGEATKQFAPCTFTCISDPLYAGADGALELATDMPEEFLEKL